MVKPPKPKKSKKKYKDLAKADIECFFHGDGYIQRIIDHEVGTDPDKYDLPDNQGVKTDEELNKLFVEERPDHVRKNIPKEFRIG